MAEATRSPRRVTGNPPNVKKRSGGKPDDKPDYSGSRYGRTDETEYGEAGREGSRPVDVADADEGPPASPAVEDKKQRPGRGRKGGTRTGKS